MHTDRARVRRAELIKAAAAQFTESNTMAYGNFVRMVSAVPH